MNLHRSYVSKFCLDEWQDETVARVINLILFTPLLALSSIAKSLATTLYYSTDFEFVILVSLTDTYYMGMIPQPVNLVEFHLQSNILVEYTNLWDIREKYFTVSSVTDLFTGPDLV